MAVAFAEAGWPPYLTPATKPPCPQIFHWNPSTGVAIEQIERRRQQCRFKCLRIGKDALDAGDSDRAVKFLSKAKRLDPLLAIDHLLNPFLNQDEPPSSSVAAASSTPRRHPPQGGWGLYVCPYL
ncbi:hypothetical protein E2562_000379 [Oryza meyeriana var. granulata]|uniref:Uncharacterized protein n=1 Tax=Oryza meyeriana var. granulata TaxID=110450 RepID=A0A6G1CC78_9ORYZ|nr:hypothetical protein E2562_000379 [Oryza meyeriana var. granulata]